MSSVKIGEVIRSVPRITKKKWWRAYVADPLTNRGTSSTALGVPAGQVEGEVWSPLPLPNRGCSLNGVHAYWI